MRRRASAMVVLALLAGCGGEQKKPLDRGESGTQPLAPIPYLVRFPPDLPPELASLLPGVSQAERDRGNPPDTRLGIQQRARADVERLQQALRAEGYFDATVDFTLTDAAQASAPAGTLERLEQAYSAPQVILAFQIV
ncbi:MAG: hypothetical protein U1E17_16855, partial [Geminicoccaceae bacterium]